jgi:hypothetical protein
MSEDFTRPGGRGRYPVVDVVREEAPTIGCLRARSVHLNWLTEDPGFSATYTLDSGAAEGGLREAVFARLACHFLVDRIPAQGLSELAESLTELFGFYSKRADEQVAGLLEAPSTPATETQSATIQGSYERPTFQIED